MSRSKKHINDLNDFLRYSGKRMRGKERNAFEKKLQKDAFDAEAAEGLSMVSPDEARKDLDEIGRRLGAGRRKKMPVFYLRIAAVVTLLAATTLILRIVRTDETPSLISENIKPPPELQPIIIPASEGIQKASDESSRNASVIRAADQQTTRYIAPAIVDTVSFLELAASENIALLDASDIEVEAQEPEIIAQVMPSMAKKEAQRTRRIAGSVVSADDNQPIPGATIVVKGTGKGVMSDANGKFEMDVDTDSSLMLVASFIGMTTQEVSSKSDTDLLIAMNTEAISLDEVVVVGYGVTKAKNTTGAVEVYNADEKVNKYVPPAPKPGFSEFKNYIESNLRYPSDVDEKTKEAVVIRIMVRSNGNIDNIEVIKSPGKAFSDEAIRLIKEGPGWIPATLNGLPQDEEVRLRIVFK